MHALFPFGCEVCMLQEKQLIAWFHKIKMGTHGCAIAFFLHNLLLQQMHKSAGWLMTQCVVRKQCCMAA